MNQPGTSFQIKEPSVYYIVLSFYYPNQFSVAWGRKKMDAVFICRGFISHTRLWKHDCSNELDAKVTNKDFQQQQSKNTCSPLDLEKWGGKKAFLKHEASFLQLKHCGMKWAHFYWSAKVLTECHFQRCTEKAFLGQTHSVSPAQTMEHLSSSWVTTPPVLILTPQGHTLKVFATS